MDSDLSSLFEMDFHHACEPYQTASATNHTVVALTTDVDTDHAVDEQNDNNEEVVGITDLFEKTALQSLADERDAWKLKAEEGAILVEKLQKRQHAKMRTDPSLARETASRLHNLERENQRLKSENKQLKDKLKDTEGEKVLLSHETYDKTNKLRGANKKAQKEKNTANKEKEKAKSAVNDKNERLKAEKNWRKERNDALAALEDQKKVNGRLTAELEVEKSGHPHMREDGTGHDYTTVVIPIEFKIYRGDYLTLQTVFDANRMKLTDQLRNWYTQWKRTKSVQTKVVGANYISENEGKKIKVGEHLYDDMIDSTEAASGGIYIPQTGGEHDGWRSKRGLSDFCRNVQADYNNSN